MDSTMVVCKWDDAGVPTCKLRVTFSVENVNYDGKNSLNLVLHVNQGLHRHCNATMFSFDDDGSLVLLHQRPGLDVDEFVQHAVRGVHQFADLGVQLFLVVHILQFLDTIVEECMMDAGEVTDALLCVDAHIDLPPVADEMLLDDDDDDGEEEEDEDEDEDEDGRFAEAPTPKDSIEKILETKKLEEGDVSNGCSVCMEDMRGGEVVAAMPCKHWFHDGCIRGWLDRSNSCPLCRSKPAVL